MTQDGPDTEPGVVARRNADRLLDARCRPPFLIFTNSRIAVVPAAGGTPRSVTDAIRRAARHRSTGRRPGILFAGLEGINSRLYRINPRRASLAADAGDRRAVGGFSFSRDFSTVAYIGGDAKTFPEVYVARACDDGTAAS